MTKQRHAMRACRRTAVWTGAAIVVLSLIGCSTFELGARSPRQGPAWRTSQRFPTRVAADARASTVSHPGGVVGQTVTPGALTNYSMSRLLASVGKTEQAEHLLDRVIRQEPEFLPAYCDLAMLEVRRGHVDEATRLLETGLRHAPGDPVLNNNLGVCLLLAGDYEQALDRFTRASAVRPDSARFVANRALAMGLMMRDAESLGLYEQIGTPEQARHNLDVITRLRAARDEGAPEDAELMERPQLQ